MNFKFIFYTLLFYLFILCITTILERFLNYQIIIIIFCYFSTICLIYLIFNFLPFFFSSEEHVLKWNVTFNRLNFITSPFTFIISLNISPQSYTLILLVLTVSLKLNHSLLQYLKKKTDVKPSSYKFKHLGVNMTDRLLALILNWFIFSVIIFILSNNLITLIFSLSFIIIFILFFIYIFIKYVPQSKRIYTVTNGFRLIYVFIVLFLSIIVYNCNKYGIFSVFTLNSFFIDKAVLNTYIYEIF